MGSKVKYESQAVTHGVVEISQDDPEGKFIHLVNYGNEKVWVGGWTLTRQAGDVETSHKLHRRTYLESKESVTVWSADAAAAEGIVHDPPEVLVMKPPKKWPTSDHVVTILCNKNGEEMAKRVTTRSVQPESERGLRDRCSIF